MNPWEPRGDSQQTLIGKIADEITERLRSGERPEVEEFVRRYPEFGDELRGVLAAPMAMRPAIGSLSAEAVTGESRHRELGAAESPLDRAPSPPCRSWSRDSRNRNTPTFKPCCDNGCVP
jgi:hypothetical protein